LRSPDVRLATITGRSGAGKTRLASEVARLLDRELPGGAVFVDCSSIDDPGLVAAAVAGALDLHVVSGQRPEDALRRSLQFEPTLILADDVDHVPDGVEALLDILDDCPGSHLLATAVAPLRARGEHVVRLGALPMPPAATSDPDALQLAPAVALFCERASAVDVGFRCTVDNAAAVAGLCERLDGLPLAIELAAARVTTLPPSAQLEMLSRSSPLDLAPLGPADRTGRHTELRAAIAWSHRLLGEREQVFFRRMAVFDGGCSLDALRDVCTERSWGAAGPLDALTNLVDVHLLEPDAAAGETRYRLLPTVVDFARERLAEAGEVERVAARHTGWFAARARGAAQLDELDQMAWLVADRDNLHAALGRLVAGRDVAGGLQLAADLAPLWIRQGLFPRTRAWFDDLLAEAPGSDVPVEVRANALLWRALLAADDPVEHDQPTTSERLDQGLQLARASGSGPVLLFGLSCVIRTLLATRDVGAAASAAGEGLALARRIGDSRWQVRFTSWAAMVAQQVGDLETAARLGADSLEGATRRGDLVSVVRVSLLLHGLPPGTPGLPDGIPSRETLLAICRKLGDVVAEGWVLGRLAWAAVMVDDVVRAAVLCADALRLGRRTGALSSGGLSIVALVIAAARRGDDEIAARLHGSITGVLPTLKIGLTAGPAAVYLAAVHEVRARLGSEAFDATAAGSALLPWDAALAAALQYAVALAGPATRGPPDRTLVAPSGSRAASWTFSTFSPAATRTKTSPWHWASGRRPSCITP
jgi:predicted ATPase